ncbi:MAG TPA: ABC transporter permease subunit [Fimbriimonadaceae bacterium]
MAFPIIALVVVGGLPNALSELKRPSAIEAIWLSIRTTLWSVLTIALLATPLAYWIGRGNRFWHRATEVLVELPLALPPAAAGVALLIAFGREGWLNLGVSFTEIAVILAQVFVAAPFFIRAVTAAFAEQPDEFYDAAESDGAGPWARFFTIGLPIASRALAGGLAISWARAAGEFGATIIFAGSYPGRTQTMPLAIYLGFQIDFKEALALSLLLLLVAVVGFAIAQAFTRRDIRSMR